MGIKGRFAGDLACGVEARPLKGVWVQLLDKGLQPVIVVDGMNFLMCMVSRLASRGLPRFRELSEMVRYTLTELLRACPGAMLHFIFDGLKDEDGYDAKTPESLRRKVDKLGEAAEAVAAYSEFGFSLRGGASSTTPLLSLFFEVVRSLEGSHRIFRAQSRSTDADVAVALHATRQNAAMLLSDDSDFLISFAGEGCVLLGRSFLFQEDGLKAKTLSVQDRLQRLRVESMGDVRLLACKLGTDLTPSVEAEHEDLKGAAWQEAVKSLLDEKAADLFLRQYDLEAYDHQPCEHGTDAWSYRGRLACGLTSVLPPGPMDPLTMDFLYEVRGRPNDEPGRADDPLASQRLFRAYCHGHLSSQIISLLQSQRAFTSCEPADFVGFLDGREQDLRPVHEFSRAWISRVAALLMGDPDMADSWEDDERDLRFQHIDFHRVSLMALKRSWDARRPVAQLEAQARRAQKDRELVLASRDAAKAKLCQELHLEDLEERVVLEAARLPQWFWHDEGDSDVWCARKFFYLVTGRDLMDLPEKHRDLVRSALMHKCHGETDLIRLFTLTLTAVSGELVANEHIQDMLEDLSASRSQGLRLGESFRGSSNPGDLRSLLILGGLAWRMLSCLQDAYCLLGHEGSLFQRHLRFDGGPVVLTEGGLVKKAAHGYMIRLYGMDDEQIITADQVDVVRSLLNQADATSTVSRDGGGFKVTHMSGKAAFKFHGRCVFLQGLQPFKLKVKALD